jgi:hypothetical protein
VSWLADRAVNEREINGATEAQPFLADPTNNVVQKVPERRLNNVNTFYV